MRNLIIKLCYWIIDKLKQRGWITIIPLEDGSFGAIDRKGNIVVTKNGDMWNSRKTNG